MASGKLPRKSSPRRPRKRPDSGLRGGNRPPRRPPREGSRRPEALYGINSVEAALQAGRRSFLALLLRQGALSPKLKQLAQLAARRDVSTEARRPAELEALCGSSNHQGAVLRCGALPVLEQEQALALGDTGPVAGKPPPLLLALDRIEDPHNLGAIVRSAAAFGAAGLVLPRDHSAPLSPAASSASAGALEAFPIHRVANLARFLDQARRHHFWVAGAMAGEEGATPLHRFQSDGPLVLVLGGEGRGLRPLVRRGCDLLITIPLPGRADMDSLNVSNAAAVLLYGLNAGGDRA